MLIERNSCLAYVFIHTILFLDTMIPIQYNKYFSLHLIHYTTYMFLLTLNEDKFKTFFLIRLS